jgi:alkylated DNA repair dioxygenase AlkB
MRATQVEGFPEGFLYLEDFLSPQDEGELASVIRALPFQVFLYKGYPAKRRVIDWGWSYDFTSSAFSEAADLPEFLLPVRRRAAEVIDVPESDLVEALITEYTPGAQINWHRDLPMFGTVLGISLLGRCTFRFRPYGRGANPVSFPLPSRSLYVMKGAARWQFQHSIPPVKELRYSITLRTLRKEQGSASPRTGRNAAA